MAIGRTSPSAPLSCRPRIPRGRQALTGAVLMLLMMAATASLEAVARAHASESNRPKITPSTIASSSTTKRPKHDLLTSVACLASTCVAAGNYTDGGTGESLPLFEQWTAKGWRVSRAAPSIGMGAYLNGVACVQSSTCFAVGDFINAQDKSGNDLFHTLVERWNGAGWTKVSSPNFSGSTDSSLDGVYCPGVSECFAVGEYVDSLHNTYPFIEQWDGTRWLIARSPNLGYRTVPSSGDEYLHSVTCTGSLSCFGVGYDSAHSRTLIEQWNGSQWSIVASPRVYGKTGPALQGTTCTTSSCFAVGSSTEPKKLESAPLIDRFDGAQWTVAQGAPYGPGNESLAGVACANPSRCFAVGQKTASTGYIKGLIEQWDGKQWSNDPKPNPSSARAGGLSAVSCTTKTCFAVGYFQTPRKELTLIEQWKSGIWTIVSSPNR